MAKLFFQKYKNSDHGIPFSMFLRSFLKMIFKDKISKYIFWISSYTSQFQMKALF